MKSLMCSSTVVALLLATCGVCNAVEILKQEPPIGTAPPGEKLLVDDGTCGRGKIKEVTIPEWSTSGDYRDAKQRQRRCIARK